MTTGTPLLPFTVSVLFVGDRVDVRIGGSLDAVTGPLLLSTLDHLASDGRTLVTLDLADVDLIDAAGCRAVEYLAARLRWVRSTLTVRSASLQARAVFRLRGLDGIIDYDTPDRPVPHAAAVPRAIAAAAASTGTAKRLLPRQDAVAVADAALRLVTTLAQATVAGADGVSVSLHRNGALVTVAASDRRIAQMDRDQYDTGQGPCLTAATDGTVVQVPSLDDETRWPDFVSRARSSGIASILSSPLQAPSGPIGALNMYSRMRRAFGAHERELAELFAEQASGVLVEAGAQVHGPDLPARLQRALHARNAIAQAQGIVMARTGDAPEGAYASLKLEARRTERSMLELCEATVASVVRGPADPIPHG